MNVWCVCVEQNNASLYPNYLSCNMLSKYHSYRDYVSCLLHEVKRVGIYIMKQVRKGKFILVTGHNYE